MNKLGCKLLWEVLSHWKAPAWNKSHAYSFFLRGVGLNFFLEAVLAVQRWVTEPHPSLNKNNSFLSYFIYYGSMKSSA